MRNLKRWVTGLLVLSLVLGLVPGQAAAQGSVVAGGSCGDGLTWSLTDQGLLTLSGTGDMTDYGWKEAPWYDYCTAITRLQVGPGVRTIGAYAFLHCSNLTAVELAQGLQEIHSRAFYSCGSLACLTLPDGLHTIENRAFYDTALTELVLPKSVSQVEAGALDGCAALVQIVVDGENQSYMASNGVLYTQGQEKLVAVPGGLSGVFQMPAGVVQIESHALSGCKKLTAVHLPQGLKTIGPYAFASCSKLTELTIPAGVTSIGTLCFQNDKALKTVTFLGAAPSIGVDAFQLTELTLRYPLGDSTWSSKVGQNYGGTITWEAVDFAAPVASGSIGQNLTWALDPMGKLTISGAGSMEDGTLELGQWSQQVTSVEVSQGVTSIGDGAFQKLQNISQVILADSVTAIGMGAFAELEGIQEIQLPSGLKIIETGAFQGTGLTQITIPASVETIASAAFSDCQQLTAFAVEPGSACFCAVDGVLFQADMEVLVAYPAGKQGDYTIPQGVRELMSYCFAYSLGLSRVDIPDSVTTIGMGSFGGCLGLTTVCLPGSLESAGVYTFAECFNLCNVVFWGAAPKQPAELLLWQDGQGFDVQIYYPMEDSSWSEAVLTTLRNDVPGADVGYLPLGSGQNGTMGSSIGWTLDQQGTLTLSGTGEIPECTSTPPSYLRYYPYIRQVVVENGITAVGANSLAMLPCAESITMAATVTRVDEMALAGQSMLCQVTLSQELDSMGDSVFAGCLKLEQLTIPATVTSLGNYLFQDCISLDAVKFLGNAPAFSSHTFDGNIITAYYPAADVTWTEQVRQSYGGSVRWESVRSGAAVSGSITAFHSQTDAITVELQDSQGNLQTQSVQGNSASFAFADVANGSYTLTIRKKNHVSRSYQVEVSDEDVAISAAIYLKGDLNYDGSVDVGDYSTLLGYVKNPETINTDYKRLCADLNGDGSVNVGDYSTLLGHVKGTMSLWK